MKSNLVIQTLLNHRSSANIKRICLLRRLSRQSLGLDSKRLSPRKPTAFCCHVIGNATPSRLLCYLLCIDYHKFERIMEKRGWKPVTNDLVLLFFGIQDAALMAENMVIATRSLGLGSCFLGSAMFRADKIAEEYHLQKRVFPLVQLAMGYPDEEPPPRPRYPLEFTLLKVNTQI